MTTPALLDTVQQHLSTIEFYLAETFKLWQIFPWERGSLVVYQCQRRSLSDPAVRHDVLACCMAERLPAGWRICAASGFGLEPPAAPKWPVHSAFSCGFDTPITPETFADIFGRTLSEEIASVAATFNSGRRFECVVANGCFALGDNATAVVQLELFDQQGKLLQTLDMRSR